MPSPPLGAHSIDHSLILTETKAKVTSNKVIEAVPPMASPTNIEMVAIQIGGDFNGLYDFKSSRNSLGRNTLGFDSLNVVYRSKFLKLRLTNYCRGFLLR